MRAESPGPTGRAEPAQRLAGAQSSAGMQINVRLLGHGVIAAVELSGELDMAGEDAFESETRAALASGAKHLVVDLRALGFMDSTGLKLLVKLNARSHREGFLLSIVSDQENEVAHVLRLTGLDKILPLVEQPPDPSQVTE